MIQKHCNLPTNRLVLISKSGFSRTALAAVDRQAGRVQALTPEVIEVDGEAVVKRLYFETINYSPTRCNVHVRSKDDPIVVLGQPDTDIYGEDGSLLGPLAYLVNEAIHLDPVSRELTFMAHNHPESDQVKTFSLGLPIRQLGYHLQHTETGDLHLIEGLEIWGNFAWAQTEIPLTLTNLGGRVYGATEVSIAGHPTVWVGTTNMAAQTTTISWTTPGAADPPRPPVPFQPTRFPDLLQLFPPNPEEQVPAESPSQASTPP
jgi:hypothetical protein